MMREYRQTLLMAAISTSALLLTAHCNSSLATGFIDPNFAGTTDFDAWDDLSRDNPQVFAANNDGDANNDYPDFFTSTDLWPAPIESVLTQGTTSTGDDDPTGDAGFDKVSGRGYPAGESIYNSFDPGVFKVFDNTPVNGLETVLFQIEIAPGVEGFLDPNVENVSGFFVDGGEAVLNYNGGSQELSPVIDFAFDTGNQFPNPDAGPPFVESRIFGFQWDLSGLGSITEYEVVWSTLQFSTNYQMQLDSSDTYSPSAAIPGDFDEDGDVDGIDFLVLQRGLGTLYDSNDLADWETNYGNPVVTAINVVPEPSTTALLVALLAQLATRRCYRMTGQRLGVSRLLH